MQASSCPDIDGGWSTMTNRSAYWVQSMPPAVYPSWPTPWPLGHASVGIGGLLCTMQPIASPTALWVSGARALDWGVVLHANFPSQSVAIGHVTQLHGTSPPGPLQSDPSVAIGQPPASSSGGEGQTEAGSGSRFGESGVSAEVNVGRASEIDAFGTQTSAPLSHLGHHLTSVGSQPSTASAKTPISDKRVRSSCTSHPRKAVRSSSGAGGSPPAASAAGSSSVRAQRHTRKVAHRPRSPFTTTYSLMCAAQQEFDAAELRDSKTMENAVILASDPATRWRNGVKRINVDQEAAEAACHHCSSHRPTRCGGLRVGTRVLRGFGNWDAVHAAQLDPIRQSGHTLMISPEERTSALKHIPGLRQMVDQVLSILEVLSREKSSDEQPIHGRRVEWLNAHVLDQSDTNARFDDHQDTTEEQAEEGDAPDRKVLYTAIIKLSRGGTTSMQVHGYKEVHYRATPGSGLLFRSNLHHRTCKAEEGVWKLALFFGFFVSPTSMNACTH